MLYFKLSYLNAITTLINCFNGCISVTEKAIYFKMFKVQTAKHNLSFEVKRARSREYQNEKRGKSQAFLLM